MDDQSLAGALACCAHARLEGMETTRARESDEDTLIAEDPRRRSAALALGELGAGSRAIDPWALFQLYPASRRIHFPSEPSRSRNWTSNAFPSSRALSAFSYGGRLSSRAVARILERAVRRVHHHVDVVPVAQVLGGESIPSDPPIPPGARRVHADFGLSVPGAGRASDEREPRLVSGHDRFRPYPTNGFRIENIPLEEGELAPQVATRAATPDYFSTMGIPPSQRARLHRARPR